MALCRTSRSLGCGGKQGPCLQVRVLGNVCVCVRGVFIKKQTCALWAPEWSQSEHSPSICSPKCRQTHSGQLRSVGWGIVGALKPICGSHDLAQPPYIREAHKRN